MAMQAAMSSAAARMEAVSMAAVSTAVFREGELGTVAMDAALTAKAVRAMVEALAALAARSMPHSRSRFCTWWHRACRG